MLYFSSFCNAQRCDTITLRKFGTFAKLKYKKTLKLLPFYFCIT